MAGGSSTPPGDQKKRRSSWIFFLLPVLVSAGVMFACGAVFLGSSPGPEGFAFSSGVERVAQEDALAEEDRASELLATTPRRLGARASLGERVERRALASPRAREETDQPPTSDDDELDWELEMADSEELEPTPEMIEAERQKIREGRPSFGFLGRPGAGLAETLRKRRQERRAERGGENPGQATVSSDQDTEILSESAVMEAGTAGAAAR